MPRRLSPERENIAVLANPVVRHSEGEIVLQSVVPNVPPAINMNYFADPLPAIRLKAKPGTHFMKHAILGAGAIGGLMATALSSLGEVVTLIVRPEELVGYPHSLSLERPSAGCVKKTRKRHAVRTMKVGPWSS